MRLRGASPAAALGWSQRSRLMVASYNKGIAALPLSPALLLFTLMWFMRA